MVICREKPLWPPFILRWVKGSYVLLGNAYLLFMSISNTELEEGLTIMKRDSAADV